MEVKSDTKLDRVTAESVFGMIERMTTSVSYSKIVFVNAALLNGTKIVVGDRRFVLDSEFLMLKPGTTKWEYLVKVVVREVADGKD